MVVMRTEGELYGEYQDGDQAPQELYGPFLIETDDHAGVVRTKTGRRRRELRGKRLAMSTQLLQRVAAEDLKAEEYAKSPPRSAPKLSRGKRTKTGISIPDGYVLCPECSTGAKDPSDCPRCDGAGIVREEGSSYQ